MRSLAYDNDFRARARRTQGWGLGLLALAGLLWIWLAVLLFTPYEAGEHRSRECTARFTSENLHNGNSACVNERDWPELLAILGGSVPLAVVGAVLYTSGSVSHRMAEHLAEVTRLDSASA
ncbi:hypothetical protein ABT154_28410 [Streptomyces sp. NPDC001728]|uniref:hypothetical protein n=1 Tax=Streptomyces sp. NPDC001728 TaxID=3154396 RepID=UPI00331A4EB7